MQTLTVDPERIQAIIQSALRAAATAPTIFDALDVTGAALRSIQELSYQTTGDDAERGNAMAFSIASAI
ncbi:hypothetical protein OVY01_16285 [Robbsia sp. Bb-Pol-6]|uniref:Uncharacterized protein n=1 Tax=Robbsia betulipollinis TaxID=2981849 RepID=A0ABT3ZQA5_9BURK|nr:hypothetical protein [Robbsia betulipollinis]MCY0388734.1 hypothetical protein [Robbsia betulipollinis]